MHDLVEVAPIPPVPNRDLFVYRVPESLRERVEPGARVRIPLGRGTRVGVVAGFSDTDPPKGLRAISDLLDEEPFLSGELLELCRWTARYYLASLAEVIATVVPTKVPNEPSEKFVSLTAPLADTDVATLKRRAPARAKAYDLVLGAGGSIRRSELRASGATEAGIKGLLDDGLATIVAERRAPVAPAPLGSQAAVHPTGAQTGAIEAIVGAVSAGDPASFVLHGVTGSGKTEVYLRAAEQALARDRDVLILVPEIALTHQVVGRTRERFGDHVAVLHSGLGPSQRWAEWRRIRRREARVVIGARSAVFAPLTRLGLLIVDEEHDGAYKQEEGIRYHARDLAVVRARHAAAAVVLGSATPSAESYQAALDGRHELLELGERPSARPLPTVEVVDLRGRVSHAAKEDILSADLRTAIDETLARGEQTLVFLNRRGFARHLQCPACGTVVSCPQCSVTLTWHKADRALACHHCHFRRPAGSSCEACGGPPLEGFGIGTENVEGMLAEAFPTARVARLDRDATARRGAGRRILEGWHGGDIDILVGTQMISKGHDVAGVTLVAVLLADLSLNMPDLRAAERTMQLLVQVAGRAGRGDEPGRVIIQTFRPEHPCITAATDHAYSRFMASELDRRRELQYPPFTRLVGIHIDADDAARAEQAGELIAGRLREHARTLDLPRTAVLGPAPPPVERVRNRWRRHVLLRAGEPGALRALARSARAYIEPMRRNGVRIIVDVDSYSM